MIGLVLVSHSRALAKALAELVRGVAGADLPLAVAGGIGDDRADLGTDATDILAAVESVYRPGGVVVLMDLGSAVLSAETALEFLDPEKRTNVRLCSAPLVEGAVAAAVQIGLGSNLETVCREAALGLAPKKQHLDGPEPPAPSPSLFPPCETDGQHWQKARLTVRTPHGLHARPAARLVQALAGLDARVHIAKAGGRREPVPADSLNRIALLDVARGDEIVVSAAGTEAQRALSVVREVVENPVPDAVGDASLPAPPPAESSGLAPAMEVLAVSPGAAVGPLFVYRPAVPEVPNQRIADPQEEWERLQRALAQVESEMRTRRRQTLQRLGAEEAAIFEAHRLMLQDPALLQRARDAIFGEKANAALAWHRSVAEMAADYGRLCNDYLRRRAEDLLDIGRRVLLALAGRSARGGTVLPEASVLAARDLSPADLAAVETGQLLGLVTVAGGPTSHCAILARALDIPAVAGAPEAVLQLAPGTRLALDGFSGRLWIDPPADVVEQLRSRQRRWQVRRRENRRTARQPAGTADGRDVAVTANAGRTAEARAAERNGADGIGLLRTEFIYMTGTEPPDEDTQLEALRQITAVMGQRTVCVRTLDAGGDKPVAGLAAPAGANPFLGVRGVRFSLSRPELLCIQLRAVLRAAATGPLKLMFPMISTVEEVERCRSLLASAHRRLKEEGREHGWPLPVGIMVETPSAALLTAELAARVDFFSIGTNDLTQYTLAAERGNPDLAAYADALHPAVLRLMQQAIEGARAHGRPVSVCGELAADPSAVPVLLGLGVDELSVAPEAVADVKALVRRLDTRRCRELATEALACDRTSRVRYLAETFAATL